MKFTRSIHFSYFSKFTFFMISYSSPTWNTDLSWKNHKDIFSYFEIENQLLWLKYQFTIKWSQYIASNQTLSKKKGEELRAVVLCGTQMHQSLSDISRISLQIANSKNVGRFQMRGDIFPPVPQGIGKCWNSQAAVCLIHMVILGASRSNTGCHSPLLEQLLTSVLHFDEIHCSFYQSCWQFRSWGLACS